MVVSRTYLSGLGVLAGLACPAFALAQNSPVPASWSDPRPRPGSEAPQFRTKTATSQAAARLVPVDSLHPSLRDRVRKVLTQPTLVTHGTAEDFSASAKAYLWLLDHPDRAALAWQRLGVQCSPISDRGQGRFGWTDDQGSEVTWFVIADGPQARIWYAEGQVRPGPLAPTIPVKAVVVLRHTLPEGETGKITHEIDVFCHADSRAAHLAYRLFGTATDRMAEQAASQLLLFFSTMARHLTQHPEQSERLLAPTPVRAASK